jgi:SUMO ligase MMS21 Smc5/6 complex component
LAKNKIMTIAYVSAALNLVDPDPDLDWDIFEQACKKIDLKVEKVFWNDERVDWAKYDLVVIRSPWDYTSQREEFLTWARQVENQVVLLNNFEKALLNSFCNTKFLKSFDNLVL